MSAFQLTDLTIGIVRFGAEVSIDPGDMGGYHVDIPLSGSVATSCGDQEIVATPTCAAVYSPGEHTIVRSWGADATQVSIKIDRAALEDELARILGRPVDRRVRFDIGFDMSSPAGRRWWSTLQLLLDAVARPGSVPDVALVAQTHYLERALIAGLLASQPHSMTEAIGRRAIQANSTALHQVVDLIAAAPGAQYTVADLAQSAGVGVRQLQQAVPRRVRHEPSGVPAQRAPGRGAIGSSVRRRHDHGQRRGIPVGVQPPRPVRCARTNSKFGEHALTNTAMPLNASTAPSGAIDQPVDQGRQSIVD